ncbi:hypothetical protein [Taibaiella soli]|uniref:Uncharacterized protein n=1 Tax=Taibaiella soli TaxID=1649169 RepID=A0A2W2BG80_9BACT|nr:hypothetical protein [Taibaiella soli]PZF72496.1 hypothetical protein DN068_11565 [Taibaiella soli]
MNKLLLKLAMLPSGVYKNMGADIPQLEALLQVKLMQDDRKPLAFGRARRQKKEQKNSIWLNAFLSLVTGFVYMMPLVSMKDLVFSLWAYYSLFLFMLSFLLITDFSNVLIDTRDKTVLLPRPINDQTLFLSRVLHIFIYLFRILVPMSLPGWVYLSIAYGWPAGLFFVVPLLLMVFMALFAVNGFYLLLLKVAKPERFKEVINYFQIGVSILLFASYYLLPQVMKSAAITGMTQEHYSWIRYFPSYWLASCWTWIFPGTGMAGSTWLSILAIVFPAFCIYATVKWLAPQFARNLGGLDAVEVHAAKVKRQRREGFYKKLAYLVNKNDEARAGFMLAWLQTSRSRSFKMKVYPSFAYVPIYFVYLLFNSRSETNVLQVMVDRKFHLLLIYMSSFTMIQALNYVSISDQYKASWIYRALPVETPGRIMGGAFKAMWLKFYLPFFVAISIFILAIWGVPAISDLLLGLMNVTLFSLILMLMGSRTLPFSTVEQLSNSAGRTLRVFGAFAIIGLFGLGHYLAIKFWMLKPLFMILSGIALWLVWDSYSKSNWNAVKRAEDEL